MRRIHSGVVALTATLTIASGAMAQSASVGSAIESYEAGRMEEAASLFELLLDGPDEARARLYLGWIYHGWEEWDEAEEHLEVDYGGEELEIGFNVNYLLDALGAVDGEEVAIGLSDSNSSCLIEGPGDTTCRYVVMPMRL